MCDGSCGAPGLTRRAFLAETTMAAVAAVLTSACGNGIFGASGGGGGPVNLTVTLASFPALGTVGAIARVDGNSSNPVAAIQSPAGTYRAFSMVCPHQGTTIDIRGSGFRCPNHGATFSATGAWTGGQNTSNLTELTVAYDAAAGTLQITGNAPSGGGGGGEDDD
jgi:Rieske Fe-S protein